MTERIQVTHGLAVCLLLTGTGFLVGCANNYQHIEPQRGPLTGVLPADAEAKAQAVRADPIGYIRQVAANCSALEQYTLRFTRYERRGWFSKMYGPELIDCWFRREPFSVRFKWVDDDIKYGESTYVAGRQGDKVRFVTRWWSPPLLPPPMINKIDPQTSVTFGESRDPITDFGLERLMERTLASLDEAGDNVVVTYQGLARLSPTGPTVHHLRLHYPERPRRVPIQELYVDLASDLPAGTVLKRGDERIDAAYFYADLKTDVSLTDEDFLLEVERAAP